MFKTFLKNLIVSVSSLSVVVQPILAQGIVPGGTSAPEVVHTANGIPMVMILTPDAAGVSHNTFNDFNVGTSGLIVNNAAQNYVPTYLGGYVQGNSNLSGGAASLVIAEVVAPNISHLDGYIEVAGTAADVVVANAYGITCNGCGFINTDHAALTTGDLTYDNGGAFSGFSVNQGTIAIGEKGLDARGVSQFDLISRKVVFDGAVHGARIRVIAGRNDVIFASGEYTAHEGSDADAPEFAIDSTVLGGMYANKITIASTEKGVGVRAPTQMSAGAGGMHITADGRLVIGKAVSAGQVNLQAQSVKVQEAISTKQALSIEAKEQIILEADAVIVSEATTTLTGTQGVLLEMGATVYGQNGVSLSSETDLLFSQDVRVLSLGDVTLNSAAASFGQGIQIMAGMHDLDGSEGSSADLNLSFGGTADVLSTIFYATGDITFDAAGIVIEASATLPASQFVSRGDTRLGGGDVLLGDAVFAAGGDFELLSSGLVQTSTGSVVSAQEALVISADELNFVGSVLSAGQGGISVAGTGAVQATDSTWVSENGVVVSGASVETVNMQLQSADGSTSLESLAGDLLFDGRVVSSEDVVFTSAEDLRVDATLYAEEAILLTSGATLVNDGQMVAGAEITLGAGQSLTNNANFMTNGALEMVAGGDLINGGSGLNTEGANAATILLQGNSVDNLGALTTFGTLEFTSHAEGVTNSGTLISGSDLTLTAFSDVTNTGDIVSGGALSLIAGGQIDSSSVLASNGLVLFDAGGRIDLAGQIQTQDRLNVLSGASIEAAADLLTAAGIEITAVGDLTQSGGLWSGAEISMSAAGSLINSGSGLSDIGASARALTLTGGTVSNSGNLLLTESLEMTATSGDLIQTGQLLAGTTAALQASNGQLTHSGDLRSVGMLSLSAETIHIQSASAYLSSSDQVTINAGSGGLAALGTIIGLGKVLMTSDGQAVLDATLLSGGDIALSSSDDLRVAGKLQSYGTISLTSDALLQLTADGAAPEGADAHALVLTGDRIEQSGNYLIAGDTQISAGAAGLVQSGNITNAGNIALTTSGVMELSGQLASSGTMTISGGQITSAASIISEDSIKVTGIGFDQTIAGQMLTRSLLDIDVSGTATLAGTNQVVDGNLEVNGETINLTGANQAGQGVLATATRHLTTDGTVFANTDLVLSGAALDLAGQLSGVNEARMTATSGDLNVSGTIAANNLTSLTSAGDITTTSTSLLLASDGDVALSSGNKISLGGKALAYKDLSVNARDIELDGTIQAGLILKAEASAGNLTSTADLVAGLIDLDATADMALGGTIKAPLQADAGATMTVSGDINSSQALLTAGDISITSTGKITSGTFAALNATGGDLTNNGSVTGTGQLALDAAGTLHNGDTSDAAGALFINANHLTNASEKRIEGDQVKLTLAGNLTNAGTILADKLLLMEIAGDTTNSGQLEASSGALSLTTNQLINSGTVQAFGGTVFLQATSQFTNQNGVIYSDQGIAIELSGALTAANANWGSISSDGFLSLTGIDGGYLTAFDVAAGTTLATQGDLYVKSSKIDVNGTLASASGNVSLTADNGGVTNTGLIYAGGDTLSILTSGQITNDGGVIMSAGSMVMAGLPFTDGSLVDASGGYSQASAIVNKNGGVIETISGNMVLAANSIVNERLVTTVTDDPDPVLEFVQRLRRECATWIGCGRGYETNQHKGTDEKTVTVSALTPVSKIVSGGSIQFDAGSVRNEYSLISADGNIVFDANDVQNLGANSTYAAETYFQDETNGWGGWSYKDEWHDPYDIQRTVTNTGAVFGTIEAGGAITGTVTGYLENTAVSSGSASVQGSGLSTPTVDPRIVSAGKVTGNVVSGPSTDALEPLTAVGDTVLTAPTVDAGTVNTAGITPDVDSALVEASTPGGTGALVLGPIDPDTISSWGEYGDVDLDYTYIVGDLDLDAVNNEQLFTVDLSAPNGYLIETRHEFIDLDAFLGSDYFFAELDYDPDDVQRRLGDALAETYLIREQVYDLTGSRLLPGAATEYEQMKALYDNAIDAQRALELTVGVSLSPQQIAALTEDIIWLEERVVSGQTVLVPQLYLAGSAGLVTQASAATITAENIQLGVGELKVDGSLLQADSALQILSQGDVSNSFGTIQSGGHLSLGALDGDLNILSGTVFAETSYLSGQSISIETVTEYIGEGGNYSTLIGPISSVNAANALTLVANDELNIHGADMFAGQDLTLFTGGDVSIGTVTVDQGHQFGAGGNAHLSFSVTHVGSTLTSEDGSVNITSAQIEGQGDDASIIGAGNIGIAGAAISAAGDVNITAIAGSVALQAVLDTDYNYDSITTGGFFKTTSSVKEKLSATWNGTNIEGASIGVLAAGNVIDQASTLTSYDGDLSIAASGGQLYAQSVTDVEASKSHYSTSYFGGFLSWSTDISELEAQALSIKAQATEDLNLEAGAGIILEGGQFTAGDSITLNASEIALLATVDTNFREVVKHKNNGFIVTDIHSVDLAQETSFTKLDAEDVDFGDASVTLDLQSTQAAFGTALPGLLGQSDEDNPSMALVDHYLPDPTGPPSTGLTQDPIVAALVALSEAAAASDEDDADEDADKDDSDENPHDYEGSMQGVALPEGAGFEYLDTLFANDQLTVSEMQLVNHHFYDKSTQLGVISHLLIAFAMPHVLGANGLGILATAPTGMTLSTMEVAKNAFITSLAKTAVTGVITGDFDIGAALVSAFTAGLGAGLTDAFSLAEMVGLEADGALGLLLKDGKLTNFSLVETLGDTLITAGVTTAINGGKFFDTFLSSFTSGVLALATADLQKLIGDQFSDENGDPINGGEGSLGHALTHAGLGCISAELQGSTCAAGAAAGAASALYSGILDGTPLTDEQQQLNAELISGIAAAFTGAGTGQVLTAAGIGRGVVANNRQLHRTEAEVIQENAAEFAKQMGISVDEAIAILTAETLRGVSDDYRYTDKHDAARAFLNGLEQAGMQVAGQTMFAELVDVAPNSNEFVNSAMNAGMLLELSHYYDLVTVYGANQGLGGYGNWDQLSYAMIMARGDQHVSGGSYDALLDDIRDLSEDQQTELIVQGVLGANGSGLALEFMYGVMVDAIGAEQSFDQIRRNAAIMHATINAEQQKELSQVLSAIQVKMLAGQSLSADELWLMAELAAGASNGRTGFRVTRNNVINYLGGKIGATNKGVPVKPLVDPATNLASPQRTQHILHGDATGGGHLWPGGAGKTPFPQSWDANKVMNTTSDIATNPNLLWKPQTGNGGLYTKSGKPARFVVTDANGNLPKVDGVPVRVIIEPAGEGIITSYPKY